MNFPIFKYLRIFSILFICGMLLHSCKREDRYYKLSSEAKDFLAYNEGDTFRLKNESSGDTVTFQVITRTMEFQEDHAPSGHFAWGTSGDNYFEVGHIIFKSDEGCAGEIWVEADFQNQFTVNINFYECFDELYFMEYEIFGDVEVNGNLYRNSYLFIGSQKLFFSKEKGILRIDAYSGEILYSLIE